MPRTFESIGELAVFFCCIILKICSYVEIVHSYNNDINTSGLYWPEINAGL